MEAGFGGVFGEIFDTDFVTNPEVILPLQADVVAPLLTDQQAEAPIFNGSHLSDPTKPHHQDQFHAQHDDVLA